MKMKLTQRMSKRAMDTNGQKNVTCYKYKIGGFWNGLKKNNVLVYIYSKI